MGAYPGRDGRGVAPGDEGVDEAVADIGAFSSEILLVVTEPEHVVGVVRHSGIERYKLPGNGSSLYGVALTCAFFASINHNKRSIVLDLKRERDREILEEFDIKESGV